MFTFRVPVNLVNKAPGNIGRSRKQSLTKAQAHQVLEAAIANVNRTTGLNARVLGRVRRQRVTGDRLWKSRPTLTRTISAQIRTTGSVVRVKAALSREYLIDYAARDIGQSEISSHVPVRETSVIEAQTMQYGSLQIVNMNGMADIPGESPRGNRCVTRYPTAEWVVQELREAFPEAGRYRYVILDRDAKFDSSVLQFLEATGLEPKGTSIRSPWQNGIAER
jgi:hypothetical protein